MQTTEPTLQVLELMHDLGYSDKATGIRPRWPQDRTPNMAIYWGKPWQTLFLDETVSKNFGHVLVSILSRPQAQPAKDWKAYRVPSGNLT